PPGSLPLPYTTLFRSAIGMAAQLLDHQRSDVFGQRPIGGRGRHDATAPGGATSSAAVHSAAAHPSGGAKASATCRAARCKGLREDRKSTRLNSSHVSI